MSKREGSPQPGTEVDPKRKNQNLSFLQAIRYKRGKLRILDQRLLPTHSVLEGIATVEDGWRAIKEMQVRGAPAIAIVGCLSLAVEILDKEFASADEFESFVKEKLDYLVTARPTAVNMANASKFLQLKLAEWMKETTDIETLRKNMISEIESALKRDVQDNINIGGSGAMDIMDKNKEVDKIRLLTHCNTGSLATGGYGTALGVVRSLNRMGKLDHVFFTETRPFNQGSRLTAYELQHENIPSTLICDSSCSLVLKHQKVTAVVVGADRIAANGDVANKIGTYQVALSAAYHSVPFYVAAPSGTIDLSIMTGDEIVIEERNPRELTHFNGLQVTPEGIQCFNPAFDVTPAELITGGIITEFGVLKPDEIETKLPQYLAKRDISSEQ